MKIDDFGTLVREICGDVGPRSERCLICADGVSYTLEDIPSGDVEVCFAANLSQKEFDKLFAKIRPRFLSTKGVRAADISALLDNKRLEWLEFFWCPKLETFEVVGELQSLSVLALRDCKRVHDLTPLSKLKVSSLSIQGGMWKPAVVESLEPIANLLTLRELSLASLKVKEGGLRPISKLRNLEELSLPLTFETEDYAYLRAAHPDVKCNALQPYLDTTGLPIDGKDTMIVGRRKPHLSFAKDGIRIKKYEAAFWELVEKFKGELAKRDQ